MKKKIYTKGAEQHIIKVPKEHFMNKISKEHYTNEGQKVHFQKSSLPSPICIKNWIDDYMYIDQWTLLPKL